MTLEEVLAQVPLAGTDPTLFWMAVILAGGGFIGWLLRDYIANLKAQAESWKSLYLELVEVTLNVTQLAKNHTSLSPQEAEQARRIVRGAGRSSGRGSRDEA